jgi:DNA-binding response OmpR family regulator
MDDYISKPIQIEELRATLGKYLIRDTQNKNTRRLTF